MHTKKAKRIQKIEQKEVVEPQAQDEEIGAEFLELRGRKIRKGVGGTVKKKRQEKLQTKPRLVMPAKIAYEGQKKLKVEENLEEMKQEKYVQEVHDVQNPEKYDGYYRLDGKDATKQWKDTGNIPFVKEMPSFQTGHFLLGSKILGQRYNKRLKRLLGLSMDDSEVQYGVKANTHRLIEPLNQHTALKDETVIQRLYEAAELLIPGFKEPEKAWSSVFSHLVVYNAAIMPSDLSMQTRMQKEYSRIALLLCCSGGLTDYFCHEIPMSPGGGWTPEDFEILMQNNRGYFRQVVEQHEQTDIVFPKVRPTQAAQMEGFMNIEQDRMKVILEHQFINADTNEVDSIMKVSDEYVEQIKLLFFFLFSESYANYTKVAKMSRQVLGVTDRYPYLVDLITDRSIYGKIDSYMSEFFTDNENGGTFESFETVAHRMGCARLNVVLVFHLLCLLLSKLEALSIKKFDVSYVAQLIRNQFMPKSYKDVSQKYGYEIERNYSKPCLALVTHNLIRLTREVFRVMALVYPERTFSSQIYNADDHVAKGGLFQTHLFPRFNGNCLNQMQRYSNNFGRLFDMHRKTFNPNTDFTASSDGDIHGQFLNNVDIHNQQVFHTLKISELQYQIFNKKYFDNLFRGPNHLLEFQVFKKIYASRLNFPEGSDILHFISMTVSFFDFVDKIAPDMMTEMKMQKYYHQIRFCVEDLVPHVVDDAHLRERVINNLSRKLEFLIAQHFDNYDDESPSVSAMDPQTLSIEQINVSTIYRNEVAQVESQIIKYDDQTDTYLYHYIPVGYDEVHTYFRGDIAEDLDYKVSIAPDFIDDENKPCVFNVFFYLWCKFNGFSTTDKELVSDFILSQPYIQNNQFIQDSNIAKIFQWCKQNWTSLRLVMFFPQTHILFNSEFIEHGIWVLVKKSHCWVGKGAELFINKCKQNISQAHVYSLPLQEYKPKKPRPDKPQCKVFYDIETMKNEKGEIMTPILLCFRAYFDGQNERGTYFGIDCISRFCDYLDGLGEKLTKARKKKEKIRTVYVYAHNGGKFDHLFLQKCIMLQHSQSYTYFGTLTDIKFSQYLGHIIFRDTNLIFPGSLKSLAKDFGVTDKGDFDCTEITAEKLMNPDFKRDLIKYCELDVQVLDELYFKFIGAMKKAVPKFTEKDLKHTLPSTALHVFQRFFLKDTKIYGNIPKISGLLLQKYERISYFGGYTQVFNHEVGTGLSYYDFVSMYVSIMIQDNFPLSQGQIKEFDGLILQTRLYILSEFEFSPDAKITNIPVKNSKTLVTIYPLYFKKGDGGNEFLCVWGKELKLAQKLGLKRYKINLQVVYADWGNVFKEYMTVFFNLKKSSQGDVAKISKLMGNSLYGKFGQHIEENRFVINEGEAKLLGEVGLAGVVSSMQYKDYINSRKSLSGQMVEHVMKLTNTLLEVTVRPDEGQLYTPGSFIRIASYITMCGRCKIISLIDEIGVDKVFYCDTDSVVFKGDGNSFKSIKIGKDVGNISDALSGVKIEYGIFASAKCYALQLCDKFKDSFRYVRFKGIKNPSLEMVTFLKDNGYVRKMQQQWKRRWMGVGIEDITKKVRLATKRYVNEDGTTRPFFNFSEYEKFSDLSIVYASNKFEYTKIN